jgi:hypothetical protein
LGLVCLEIGTAYEEESFYHDNGDLNINRIKQKLTVIKDRYSIDLYSIIREMLIIKSELRPDPS